MSEGKRGRLNLILRGHVRSSFGDMRLRELVDEIRDLFDVRVYAQTWNIFQNNISWRRLEVNESKVCSGTVLKYFGGENVKKVLILNDGKISHLGNVEGKIGRTPCPIIAWKNMYYGMMAASSCVLQNEGPSDITVQMRFDILSNSFSKSKGEILDFMKRDFDLLASGEEGDERMRFLYMRCFLGVDNIYMARNSDLHKFICYMYYDMDRILHFHRRTIHQEHISFHERKSFVGWNLPADPVDTSVALEESA